MPACSERQPIGQACSFLLSAVDTGMSKLTDKAAAELIKDGPIFSTRISYRAPYISAMTAGKVGFEVDKELRDEANTLWEEVKRLVEASQIAVRGCAVNDR
jgi:hypothetical protein